MSTALSTSGGGLALRDNAANLIDSVGWGLPTPVRAGTWGVIKRLFAPGVQFP